MTVPAAVLLTGCVTTQQIAARTRLVEARIRASQSVTQVGHENPEVQVAATEVIRAGTGTAIVARLVNRSPRTLTDLPISIGVRTTHGPNFYLNRSANLDYFETHVSAIPPRGAVTWVTTTGRRLPDHARAFAVVGSSPSPQAATAALPRIDVKGLGSVSSTAHGTLELSIRNLSAIPQYDLPVYAVATRAGRDVAAGRVAVAHLGTHGSATLRMTLVGRPQNAELRFSASPTIFS